MLKRIDNVTWTPEEIGRLKGTHHDEDQRLADIIKAGLASHWRGPAHQVFFLTRPGEDGDRLGHVTLEHTLDNLRSGRGSGWVQRQRYVSVTDLRSARTLAELDQQ